MLAGAEVVTSARGRPGAVLQALVADGVAVRPSPEALRHAQDKLVMRRALTGAGRDAGPRRGRRARGRRRAGRPDRWPVVLKAVRGGYDSQGRVVGADPELVAQLLAAGTPLIAEQAVTMRRELAVQVARSPYGQAAAWPVVETVRRNGPCVEVLAAPV